MHKGKWIRPPLLQASPSRLAEAAEKEGKRGASVQQQRLLYFFVCLPDGIYLIFSFQMEGYLAPKMNQLFDRN